MSVENTGHKSPRKQTSSVLLLREQLVSLCNSCTCIHLRATLLQASLLASRFLHCNPIVLRTWSQTPKPSELWTSLTKLSAKYLTTYLPCMSDTKIPYPRLEQLVYCSRFSIHELQCIFLPHSNTAKIRELRSSTHLQPKSALI